jgi:pimeloyl-ACP methyl ester carboxylesterase
MAPGRAAPRPWRTPAILDQVAALLAPHLRVVTYDQRGHDASASASASDYSLDAFLSASTSMRSSILMRVLPMGTPFWRTATLGRRR